MPASQSISRMASYDKLTVELYRAYGLALCHLSELCRRNAQYCVKQVQTVLQQSTTAYSRQSNSVYRQLDGA